MESSSTSILTTITSTAGVGGICVYIQAIDKVFDCFEQFDKCTTAGYYTLGRLDHLDVTRISKYD